MRQRRGASARFAWISGLLAISTASWAGCASGGSGEFGGSGGAGGEPGEGGSGAKGAGGPGAGGEGACPAGSALCDGQCVAVASDASNCGACGKICEEGELCSGGLCTVSCLGGATKCGAQCVDTRFDPEHCGACGAACGEGELCSEGQCGIGCSGGTTQCGDKCVDTNFDPKHCGACGEICAAGEVCSEGACSLACSGGTEACGDKCVDTELDPSNCGACGQACAEGELCSAGKCAVTCLGGTKACGGKCVDTLHDLANCGACGAACGVGEVCSGGQCGLFCGAGTTQCGSQCVDTDVDPAHCGDCATKCAEGEVCAAGTCGAACIGGATECGGKCANTNTDPAHCGACDKACAEGEVCSGGQCGATCPGGLAKCGSYCVNTQADEANCGACGAPCGPAAECVGGQCVECDSDTTDCDGDGWKKADGDCCDKPGPCGAEPAKINPGAIEVVGNALDDNCNGKTDLFDQEDTVSCDAGLAQNSTNPVDYAKALGICRQTTVTAPLAQKTWGLIEAKLLRADGSPLAVADAVSIRPGFGSVAPGKLEGDSIVVLSTGIAADGSQTDPGPNGGAPSGSNVSETHSPSSSVDISSAKALSVADWYATPNPPLKPAGGLPDAPGCNSSDDPEANDSVMLYLKLRAPTNARAFSFNSYFFSAEYPEFVCSSFNDQLVALVDTNGKTTSPIANPVDKNLMTYFDGTQKWPIGINIAKGTSLFAVCSQEASCSDSSVSPESCSLGDAQLAGTGFETGSFGFCPIGGGTFWLTTAGNVVPGDIVELRIAIWDVGDHSYDSMALVDGFRWLSAATLPGTGN